MRARAMFISDQDRTTLQGWIRAPTTPQRTALRSRLILLLGDGLSARAVARQLNVSRHTVDLWRERYRKEGCDTLLRDRPGRGRRRRTDESPAGDGGRDLSASDRSFSPASSSSGGGVLKLTWPPMPGPAMSPPGTRRW